MKKEISEKELFETIPVPKAVATLGNLFGLGGGSLISRMMGIQNHEDIKHVSAFCVWIGAAATLVFSLLTFAFRRPLLNFLGASPDTYDYAQSYLLWVVVIGGVPTMLSLSLGHLLRSEGHARPASIGMMFGGILNVVLDPVLIFGFDLDVAGAAIATAFSNLASVVFFVVIYIRLGKRTSVSLHPKNIRFQYIRQVFSVGLATALGNASNMVIVKLSSGYGDIPVAAYGIVKRIDQLPLNVSMGLCQGFMPLVGYNYASGNYNRMRTFSRQGLLNIPLLILMNVTIGLYGMIWTQLVVEVIMLPVSLGMYWHTLRRLNPQRENENNK
mgnify:CR=1 FL=1